MEVKSHEVSIKIEHEAGEDLKALSETFAQLLAALIKEFPTKEEKQIATYKILKLFQQNAPMILCKAESTAKEGGAK